MRLLLDTHAVLWFLSGDARLSHAARVAIEDEANTRFCSIASLWEIAIKVSLGKLPLSKPFAEVFPAELTANAIDLLPITPGHLSMVASLPLHHRDPFDRLLAAQCTVEGFDMVSRDTVLDLYRIHRIW